MPFRCFEMEYGPITKKKHYSANRIASTWCGLERAAGQHVQVVARCSTKLIGKCVRYKPYSVEQHRDCRAVVWGLAGLRWAV